MTVLVAVMFPIAETVRLRLAVVVPEASRLAVAATFLTRCAATLATDVTVARAGLLLVYVAFTEVDDVIVVGAWA